MGWMRRMLLAMAASVLLALAACGSSDHRHFEPWEAEGLWSGSTSSGGTFDGVILDTGEYWFVYGTAAGAGSVIHGTGFFRRGRFHSDDGLDYFFGYDRPFRSAFSATVDPERRIDGDIYIADRLEGFSMRYDPEYRFPADLREAARQWRGSATRLLTSGDFVMSVDINGAFTASLAGSCDYTGRMLPNRNGRNVFDITLSSVPACPVLFSANGVAVVVRGRLVITAITPDRGDVFYAVAQ
jgi:hypothetical protein